MKYVSFGFAEDLDHSLGDPNDPDCLFSYQRSADRDRLDQYPTASCARLDALGVSRYYVPARFGGALDNYEDLMMLIRILARRDFAVALAHANTYLGSACVWIGGEQGQAEMLAAKVLDGGVVSLALAEAAHGSDLLAGEVSAEQTATGYRVDGEKWLVGNAARGSHMCLLVRTDPEGGQRGFSLLLVDKQQLAGGRCEPLPAARTHGVRGADIGGVRFAGAEIPLDAVIGASGAGLETVRKSMQLTRVLCGAMSLGMGDHALRLAVDFVAPHRLYNRQLMDLPQASRALTLAYADLLITEAVTFVSTRSIHALSGELSVVSAVVKYWVSTTIDGTITSLSRVLGARALLTEAFADGRFDKTQRDHQMLGVLDGDIYATLSALVNQFAGLASGYKHRWVDGEGLRAAVTLDEPLPEFDRDQLSLMSRTGCSLVQNLPASIDELLVLAERGEVPAILATQGSELREITEELHERLAQCRAARTDVPVEAFALARRYADCYAAAACLELWLRNRDGVWVGAEAGLWKDGAWLSACLARLLARLQPPISSDGGAAVDGLVEQLRVQHQEGQLFSLLSLQLIGERRQETQC